ncbi:MAG: hypothetical protein HYZ71_09900, partial [Deltaproteobacteria bacterium]|nr:hypothetical protein [Deltaproteobacteria bacterium]
MKVRLLIAAILFLPLPLRAQIPLHRILQTQYQGISQTFLKEVTFHSPTDQPGFVVYGNLRYGYYKLTDFQRSDGKIRFSFLPPGYQSPIEFYFRAKRDTRLGTRLFQNPTPRTFLPLSGRVKGRLSTPYVLMGNGVQVPTDGDDLTQTIQFQAVVILNRFGEIVWLHVPVPGNQFSVQEINAKQIGPGRYGLIQSHDHFEVVDYRG